MPCQPRTDKECRNLLAYNSTPVSAGPRHLLLLIGVTQVSIAIPTVAREADCAESVQRVVAASRCRNVGDQSAAPFIEPMSPVIRFNTIGFTTLASGKKAARGLPRERLCAACV
jgi:hypothetical protein